MQASNIPGRQIDTSWRDLLAGGEWRVVSERSAASSEFYKTVFPVSFSPLATGHSPLPNLYHGGAANSNTRAGQAGELQSSLRRTEFIPLPMPFQGNGMNSVLLWAVALGC
jgi:hypothetical protein